MDKTRIADLEMLEGVIRNPHTSSGEKSEAKENARKIANESGLVKSMRERLVKEMRAGRADNVRDISEYVQKHSKYQ